MKCPSFSAVLLLLAALLLLACIAPSARAETDHAEAETESEFETEAETEAEAEADAELEAPKWLTIGKTMTSVPTMTGPAEPDPTIALEEVDRMGDVAVQVLSPSLQSHLPNGRTPAAIDAWAAREWASVKAQATQFGVYGTKCIAGPGIDFTRLGVSFNARLADAPFYYRIQETIAHEQPIESCRPVFNVVFCSAACSGHERTSVGLCGQAPAHTMGVVGGMGPLSDAGMSMGVNDLSAQFAGKCSALHVYSSTMGRLKREFFLMQRSNGASPCF